VRNVILKPRDEAKDLPKAWSDVGRLINSHFAFCILHFAIYIARTHLPTELPNYRITGIPNHQHGNDLSVVWH
jgi:hypothetical protein